MSDAVNETNVTRRHSDDPAYAGALPDYTRRAGAGPTLVFLHYWGGSARTWTDVVDRLPGRDVLTLDFRGWSNSKSLLGPFSLRQLARDTLGVIADAGLSDFVLIGHSMGGKVSQLVASTRPAGLRGIVLVAPGPSKPAAAVTAEYRDGLSHAYDDDETTATARDRILTARPLSDAVKAQVLEDSRSSSREAGTEWPLRGIAEDITAEAEKISVPVLVLAGENDVVEPVDVLRSNLLPYLSDATFEVLPETGHLMPLEVPGPLADAIVRFVSARAVTAM
jgi:pimeloyl-ACP methyl ester carboxylesterase